MVKKSVLFSALGYFPDFGGIENSLRFLTKEFAELGYQPLVLVAQSRFSKYKRVSKVNGVVVLRFKLRPFKSELANLLFSPFAILDLLLLFRLLKNRKRICLSVNRNQLTGFLATFFFKDTIYLAPGFSKFQAKPAMLNSDMAFFEKLMSSIKSIFHHWFDKGVLKRSAKIFLFSENMKEQAFQVEKSLRERVRDIKITKPGVDLTLFQPVTTCKQNEIRSLLGLPPNKTLILSVGRFVSAKGFRYLISSVKYLPSNVSIVIVGDGPEKEQITRDSQDLINQGRVILVGKSNQVSKYYAASDLFVLSSVYEPLGQTVLEAAATGLPVVSFFPTRENGVINATYELLGDLAIYSREKSPKGLAKAINKCLHKNGINREDLSSQIRNTISIKCNWRSLALELLKSRSD